MRIFRKGNIELPDKMLLTNNRRRYAGLPTLRKKSKGKRFLTRCEAIETINAFIDYCNR